MACCDSLLVIDKIPKTQGLDLHRAVETLLKREEEMDVNSIGFVLGLDCPVCYNDKAWVINKQCGHVACKGCWLKLARMEPMRCFVCLEETDLTQLEDKTEDNMVEAKKSHDDRILHRSSKTKEMLRILGDELSKGNKVIIVSQWTSYLEVLIQHYKCSVHRDVSFVKLDGKTDPMKRQKIVDEFQANDDIKVCFASLTSSSEGITLHSACAMIICDAFWNQAKISQISDRIHRIGQTKDVTIHNIYVQDSIEMRLRDLVHKKDMICRVIVDCLPVTKFVDSWLTRMIKLLE